MRKLEEQYGDRIAVVGIHSGKYTAERVTAHIRDAALRLHAVHPTLNDKQFRVWRSYAVQAWPTLVAIDPRGYVVGVHAGEFTADDLAPFIDRILGEHAAVDASVHLVVESPTHAPTSLRFPGNIAVDADRVAISDSGNNRVLIGRLDGASAAIERVVDGFINPQGLAFGDATLFVADAGAHDILAVDCTTGTKRRLAGIGRQARTQRELDAGALSSPWDVVVHGASLYVAMAGMHQLWKIDLTTGAGAAFAGSGAEELHDAEHAMAALAQPMGLTRVGDTLLFCDSESSAVRSADLDIAGRVSTIVGTGLFDFGDVDGVGDAVRLQHPQGIVSLADGRVLISDSYNGALKWIDPQTRTVTTWLTDLEEPTGLASSANSVYVTETNAHRIVVVDIASQAQTELELVLP